MVGRNMLAERRGLHSKTSQVRTGRPERALDGRPSPSPGKRFAVVLAAALPAPHSWCFSVPSLAMVPPHSVKCTPLCRQAAAWRSVLMGGTMAGGASHCWE